MSETLPIIPNAGDNCLTVEPSGNYVRPWDRLTSECPGNFTSQQLDMRRKIEILKYNNHDSKLNKASKKSEFVNAVKGNHSHRKQYASQSINGGVNNPNVHNLVREGNSLIIKPNIGLVTCPTHEYSGFTSAAGVPGPNIKLTLDESVPLTRFSKSKPSLSNQGLFNFKFN